MFGQDSLYNTLYGLQRQDQATANNNQNLSQAQQDQMFQAQDQPINLQQLAANVGHTQALTGFTNAQTPGMAAESTMKQNAANIDTSTLENKRQKVIADLAAGLTEAQARQHQAQAESDLFAALPNGTPDMRKRQEAHMVLDNMPAIVGKIREIQAQGANEANVANITQGGANSRDAADIEAGKYNKSNLEYLKFQANAKANFQQQAGIARSEYSDYSSKAQTTTDPDEKAFYTAKADQAKKDYDTAVLNDYRAKQAAGTAANAGKLNVAPIVGGQNVVDVNTLPAPPGAPIQDVRQPTDTGMIPMKDKNGVPHLVPKGNVQKALSGGWTQ